MSGSRRNRILNLNQSPALPNHQPSHQQQVGSALTPYQRPAATPNNSITAGVAPRPMVIQYAVPHYPPPGHSIPTQAAARSQYPSQIPTPTRALPPPSPTKTSPTTDFAMDRLTQLLVAAITPIFSENHNSVAAAIKKVEDSVKNFATDAKEARTETDKRLFQLTEAMQKSLQAQQTYMKTTNKRLEKLEALIMASINLQDEASLISRIENIQYTVGELMERVKDPGAQDFFIASQPPTQTANDVEARDFPSPPESIEERAPSPVQRVYEDKSMSCDIPEPLPERAPSLVRPIYKDAATDVVNLEPEPPVMASLIWPEHRSVGSGPQTPSLPRRLQRTLSSPSFEPSSGSHSDCPRSSVSSFRAESSEVTTEIEKESRNNTEIPDVEEVNLSPKLKRKNMNTFNNSEEENIVMAHSERDDAMVIDTDNSVDAELHVDMESELDKILTDGEVHNDAPMGDSTLHLSSFIASPTPELQSDSPVVPIVKYASSAPSRSPTPVEGSVAELRQSVFGSSREGSLFTPVQDQQQCSLPSPATTPSVPASPGLSPPPASSALAATPSRQLTQQRPVFTVSSPTSSSNLNREVSLPKSDHAEPTSIPVPMPLTPESAPFPKINVTPNSDDGSELSVSRMVTAQPSDSPDIPSLSSPVAPAPEHVEQPQEQASLSLMPLFIPESRSQSPHPVQLDDASFESPGPFLESPPPSPIPTYRTASKSQSARPTAPVVVDLTSPTSLAPATIFNTPFKKLKRVNSQRSVISIKSTPQKTPMITRQVIVRHTRPPQIPRPKSAPEPIVIHSSPIFVPSRSLSPLSVLSSASEDELEPRADSDAGSDAARVVRRKEFKKKRNLGLKVQTEPGTSAAVSAGGSVGPSTVTGTGAGTRRIDLSQKLLAKKAESAALTRVRKRKAPTVEEMEPPLKRARQKASVSVSASVSAPVLGVEREVRVKRERMSVGLPSANASVNIHNGRGKGKGREREREDDKGYRLSTMKLKLSPKEKTLRSRPPPPGVKWPQKNMSGDKKFDNHFIECEKCFTWYHYGCIGIRDSNDPIIKGDQTFICPPCSGGGANPMLPSSNISCGRPDCENDEKKDDEFFMTAIIGRHTKVSSVTGRKYMWLVKWDGYPIKDCTWEAEDGMSDPQSFIQDFIRKATREGKDPDEDPYSTILLREAINGGWTDPNA